MINPLIKIYYFYPLYSTTTLLTSVMVQLFDQKRICLFQRRKVKQNTRAAISLIKQKLYLGRLSEFIDHLLWRKIKKFEEIKKKFRKKEKV